MLRYNKFIYCIIFGCIINIAILCILPLYVTYAKTKSVILPIAENISETNNIQNKHNLPVQTHMEIIIWLGLIEN